MRPKRRAAERKTLNLQGVARIAARAGGSGDT
jgi:hypothetical protein